MNLNTKAERLQMWVCEHVSIAQALGVQPGAAMRLPVVPGKR